MNETLTTQYDLVCDKKTMINDFNSIAFAGLFCAGLYAGFLADKFGRKPMILVSLIAVATIGFTVAIFNAMGVYVYVVGRFFLMFFMYNGYLRFVPNPTSIQRNILKNFEFLTPKCPIDPQSARL